MIRKDGSFETPVITSLYSWARDPNADKDEAPQKFGWWGSSFADDENDNYGSLLWTYRRSKNTPAERSRLNGTLQDALAWMLTDQVAKGVGSETERFDLQVVAGKISITRADGKRWDSIWEIQRDAIQ